MNRVLVVILLALTIIQTVDAYECTGKNIYDSCGTENEGICVCSNRNAITDNNAGENPCMKLVCRIHVCFTISGRDAIPKMGENGQFLYCNNHADCGRNFMCMTSNYCCPIPKGKHSDLLTDGPYGK
ncbi:uncharacterized protein LOC132757017 [Ruditapes philippinarum]|uniref:uncharacterized protein LOC132757017 n=1 Tax=Ruditapes philippinarum TaxID=129788 RepID=UPI00295AE573|nr:uncharacterized protein LOC132757017 [Ruditapes philippinarum]